MLAVVGFLMKPTQEPIRDLLASVNRQLILSAEAPETDNQKATKESFSQMTLQAVGDEDYALVATIQGARHAGANDSFLIARNEPAVQHYRRSIASICGT